MSWRCRRARAQLAQWAQAPLALQWSLVGRRLPLLGRGGGGEGCCAQLLGRSGVMGRARCAHSCSTRNVARVRPGGVHLRGFRGTKGIRGRARQPACSWETSHMSKIVRAVCVIASWDYGQHVAVVGSRVLTGTCLGFRLPTVAAEARWRRDHGRRVGDRMVHGGRLVASVLGWMHK
jgi:hypothetical protein